MGERVKLTEAQRKFLEQLRWDEDAGIMNPGFDFDVLRGSETAMARRLEQRGLVREAFKPLRGPYWIITPAGRQALKDHPHD